MVDFDDLKSGGKEKKKQKKEGQNSSSSENAKPQNEDAGEPFTLEDESRMGTEDVNVSEHSKEMANDAELNFDVSAGSYSEYKRKQVKEVQELHEDMKSVCREHSDNMAQWTMVMHTVYMNFAQNRIGIAEHIHENWGKDMDTALKEADRICEKAGESDTLKFIVRHLTDQIVNG